MRQRRRRRKGGGELYEVFCNQHVLPHVLANPGHFIGTPSKDDAALPSRPLTGTTSGSARLCKEHGKPGRYFCKQCKIAICGDRIIFRRHRKHDPIDTINNIAKDIKDRVRRKTSQLRDVHFPEAQRSLSAGLITCLLSCCHELKSSVAKYEPLQSVPMMLSSWPCSKTRSSR